MIARAVSTSVRCSPTARAPPCVTAMSEPIAASEIATTDSATSTSIRVKPRALLFPLMPANAGIQFLGPWVPAFAGTSGGQLEPFRRNHLSSSGEQVDTDLIADAEAGERDGAAAGHAGREELDGLSGRALIAARRKQS